MMMFLFVSSSGSIATGSLLLVLYYNAPGIGSNFPVHFCLHDNVSLSLCALEYVFGKLRLQVCYVQSLLLQAFIGITLIKAQVDKMKRHQSIKATEKSRYLQLEPMTYCSKG